MAALWIIVTFVFTFTTLAVVGYGIVRAFRGSLPKEHAAPTVDRGWRAWA
jgi:hypothetical protein